MTQTDKILLTLENVYPDGISALDILKLGGGLRASARIHDLRKRGYIIQTDIKNKIYYYKLTKKK
jgi:hypothetical protein